jgi:thiamine biosynthesis lipoprotein
MKQVEVIPAMGTMVSLDVRTPASAEDFREAVESVTRRLQEIDEVFSPWRPDSWVSRLISGTVGLLDCPVEVQRVVETALGLVEPTDGFFSPFWRRLPYGDPGPDPTGLVKGWAAQEASDLLIARGLPDHVVNAAGDIVACGQSTPGDPTSEWRIGIADPYRERELAGVVNLGQDAARWAVATSGTAELGPHVSDPHTGRFPPAVASATVVARVDGVDGGAAAADAGATALVAAAERAPDLLEELGAHGLEGFLIDGDGTLRDPRRLLRVAPAL